MSAATKAALTQAIEAHVRDEDPDSITGAWVCIAETTNLDDLDHDQGSIWVATNGSPFTCRGLVETYRDGKPEEDA